MIRGFNDYKNKGKIFKFQRLKKMIKKIQIHMQEELKGNDLMKSGMEIENPDDI